VGTHTFGRSGWATTPDGRRLHYMQRGSGGTTVVFESGMGFSRSCWGLVQPAVASGARAVVYDRAGFGRSDADTHPRTLDRLAADLGSLLDSLGPGPFVLVGHSWGGPIVRVAAAAAPSRIAGIVLVDQSDENCGLYFSRAARWQFALSAALTPVLARTGLYRLMGAGAGSVQPPDVAAEHRAEDFSPAAARAANAELRPFLGELGALRGNSPQLGEIPVTLISGTSAGRMERSQRAAIVEAHRVTAAGLTRARVVEAPASGHMVMFSEPELIVDEILALVGPHRAGG